MDGPEPTSPPEDSRSWNYRGPVSALTLPGVRRDLHAWVCRTGGEGLADSVVLACWEAMANVLDHAYRDYSGPIDIRAEAQAKVLKVTIADHGQWKPPREHSGEGRGLRLVQALADGVNMTSTDEGTTVVLTWPLRRSGQMSEQIRAG